MMKIPSLRIFGTNWLNYHYNRCFKLARRYYETTIIGDSKTAGSSRYQNVCAKFLQSLKLLNCRIGGEKVQHVLSFSLNLTLLKALKSCCFMWFKQDITYRIKYLARTFKLKYDSIIIFIFGVRPGNYNWSVNWVCIKEFNLF